VDSSSPPTSPRAVVERVGEQLEEQARIAESRAAALRRALDEREGLPPRPGRCPSAAAARAERARGRAGHRARRCGGTWHRAAALLADTAGARARACRARAVAGLGSLVSSSVGPDDLSPSCPSCRWTTCCPHGSAVTRKASLRPRSRRALVVGEAAEAIQLELEAQLRYWQAQRGELATPGCADGAPRPLRGSRS